MDGVATGQSHFGRVGLKQILLLLFGGVAVGDVDHLALVGAGLPDGHHQRTNSFCSVGNLEVGGSAVNRDELVLEGCQHGSRLLSFKLVRFQDYAANFREVHFLVGLLYNLFLLLGIMVVAVVGGKLLSELNNLLFVV